MKLYVKERSKKLNISLQDISKGLELKSYPSFLRTLDNGDNLKLRQLQIIADMLQCSIGDLLIDPDAPQSESIIKCPHCGKSIKFEKGE